MSTVYYLLNTEMKYVSTKLLSVPEHQMMFMLTTGEKVFTGYELDSQGAEPFYELHILALYSFEVIEVSSKLHLYNLYVEEYLVHIYRDNTSGICQRPTAGFSGNLETTVKMPVLHNHRLLDH